MIRVGKAHIVALIYGDWHTAISAARSSDAYRDALLDQKPEDDDGDYEEYQVELTDLAAFRECCQVFGNTGLRVELRLWWASADGAVRASLQTGSMYSPKDNTAQVTVTHDDNNLAEAIRAASAILKEALT